LIQAEQTILANFFNSLENKGTLNWTTTEDFCLQEGVTCTASNPQSITNL